MDFGRSFVKNEFPIKVGDVLTYGDRRLRVTYVDPEGKGVCGFWMSL